MSPESCGGTGSTRKEQSARNRGTPRVGIDAALRDRRAPLFTPEVFREDIHPLGTVANWQQHVLPRVFEQPGREIEQALGRELPADARLDRTFTGPERLVVPTDRTALEPGEPLRLEAIVWAEVPFRPLARGVWRVELPSPGEDLEYTVEAISGRGAALRVPAGGRDAPRTVVVFP